VRVILPAIVDGGCYWCAILDVAGSETGRGAKDALRPVLDRTRTALTELHTEAAHCHPADLGVRDSGKKERSGATAARMTGDVAAAVGIARAGVVSVGTRPG